MEENQRANLRRHHVALVEELDPSYVLDQLYEDGILTESDCERINCLETRKDKSRLLLSMLLKRGPTAYGSFANALNINYPHLENLLNITQKGPAKIKSQVKRRLQEERPHAFPQNMKESLSSCSQCGPFIPNISDENLSNKINSICCSLVENVEANDILDLHYQESVLNEDACERVRCEKTRRDRLTAFFGELSKSNHMDVLSVFTMSLQKKYGYIAERLQKQCMEDSTVPQYPILNEVIRRKIGVSVFDIARTSFKQTESQSFQNQTNVQNQVEYLPCIRTQNSLTSDQNFADGTSQYNSHPNFEYLEWILRRERELKQERNLSDKMAQKRLTPITMHYLPSSGENHKSLVDSENPRSTKPKRVQRCWCNAEQPDCLSSGIKRQPETDSKSESESASESLPKYDNGRLMPEKHQIPSGPQSQSPLRVPISPGALKPYALRSKRLEVTFNHLSTLINQGYYHKFQDLAASLKCRYDQDSDMMCILEYLHASRNLFSTDLDVAKKHINLGFELAPKTSNPKYFMLELFSAQTRMYVTKRKVKKLRKILDDAKMVIATDPVGCSGRAAGWLYMNDVRHITAQTAMLNTSKQNFPQKCKNLRDKAIKSCKEAMENFKRDSGKDGPFGFGFAVCRLVILLLQCGDNGLTMDLLHPDAEDIKTAGTYISQLEDSDIPIPKILEMHFLLAKCDYQYRRQNTIRSLEHAEAAYNLANELKMLEFCQHAWNRVVYLKTKTPLVLQDADEELVARILSEDPTDLIIENVFSTEENATKYTNEYKY